MGLISESRSRRSTCARIRTILHNFGLSPKKFVSLLHRYVNVTQKYGCQPTFPITATVLKNHTVLIRRFADQGVEFPVHGYTHINMGKLSLTDQREHIRKAVRIFDDCDIPFSGFRAPYLQTNEHTINAIKQEGKFVYDSSKAIHWDVIDKADYPAPALREYQRLLDYYCPNDSKVVFSLPRTNENLVEIPVSIPDDEAFIERLGITDEEEKCDIWFKILKETYDSGELFTLQLHPERIIFCEDALVSVIQRAREHSPKVWIATLGEIADWWQKKNDYSFEIQPDADNNFKIKASCSDRAMILVKNAGVNNQTTDWFNNYQSISRREFVIKSARRPVIGIKSDSSKTAIEFIRDEGYACELSDSPDNYALYLHDLGQFCIEDARSLSKRIEQSDIPLLRYWRWPGQFQSALAITGDIDSITLKDFALRTFDACFVNFR